MLKYVILPGFVLNSIFLDICIPLKGFKKEKSLALVNAKITRG